mgnify:CR=1 FL=1
MTPEQLAAIEAVHGTALTEQQAADIAAWVDARDDRAVAEYLSADRTEVRSRIVSARGIAERMPGGPIAAEAVLLKLEGARDALLASADQGSKVLGSLLRRQLVFLAGEGLDMGSAALRGMLDQFVGAGIITSAEAGGLKALAVFAAPLSTDQVSRALNEVSHG